MKPARSGAFLVIIGSVALALAGCGHLWVPPAPKLIFGPPVMQGEQGEIVVSVADVPGGAGAVGVKFGGFRYPADAMDDLRVEGVGGFVVLAQRFEAGEGGFVVSSISGIEAGPVARIRFRALREVAPEEIALDGGLISLVDEDNELVEFELSQPAYYAR